MNLEDVLLSKGDSRNAGRYEGEHGVAKAQAHKAVWWVFDAVVEAESLDTVEAALQELFPRDDEDGS